VGRRSPKTANVAALPSVGLEDELDHAYAETSSGRREAALDHISKGGNAMITLASTSKPQKVKITPAISYELDALLIDSKTKLGASAL
jgi:hypothetical protein